MGCSCPEKVNDKIIRNNNLTNLEGKEGVSNQEENITSENDLKIFVAMFVNENKENIIKLYNPIKLIGKGSYGKVYLVEQNRTNKKYAMKVVKKGSKNDNSNNPQKNKLREINLLRRFDHPNILKVYEYFATNNHYYFIMEYMKGGELFSRIKKVKLYKEKEAAVIMKQIFSSVYYLHQLNIAHRDLKPENMMLIEDDKSCLDIKLVDFGTANYLTPGKKFTLKVGTPNYIAPEVLKGSYGKECDLWSCGVIMYLLLSGQYPFVEDEHEDIITKVIKGEYSLSTNQWTNISEEAKDLVRKLLDVNPNTRIVVEDAIHHPWIQKNCKRLSVASCKIESESDKKTNLVICEKKIDNKKKENNLFVRHSLKESITRFDSKKLLNQASIAYIVHQMDNDKIVKKLTEIFKSIDKSGDGLISLEELKEGYNQFFEDKLTDEEFEEVMKNMDQDKSGQISIEEFLRATIDYENIINEKNLKIAFDAFDKDHSGYLSPQEIKEIFGLPSNSKNVQKIVEDIMKDADLNGDGRINFEEFHNLLTKTNQIKI